MTPSVTLTRLTRTPSFGLLRAILHWHQVAQGRAALRDLDDHTLADIGLTREAALAEAARPFWDAGQPPCRKGPVA